MALIGIIFPLLLWGIGGVMGLPLQDSISAYYHTPLRNIFVGSLCAVGGFLYFYKGVSTRENIALNIAGIFAVLVAMLPTPAPPDATCETFTAPYWHGVCALLFFAAIAYVCIFRAGDTLNAIPYQRKQRLYRLIYYILGALMLILPVSAALLLHFLDKTGSIVFFVELAGIWVFGIYWITKTLEIRESHLDYIAF